VRRSFTWKIPIQSDAATADSPYSQEAERDSPEATDTSIFGLLDVELVGATVIAGLAWGGVVGD